MTKFINIFLYDDSFEIPGPRGPQGGNMRGPPPPGMMGGPMGGMGQPGMGQAAVRRGLVGFLWVEAQRANGVSPQVA